MHADRFWRYIEDARFLADGDLEDAADLLGAKLSLQPPAEILAFARAFRQADLALYRWDMWAAAHILNGGCDATCFEFFRWYVVGLGRERYERAYRDPDSLAFLSELSTYQFAYDAETLGYAAAEAYESVTGRELPPLGPPTPAEPAGEPWDEEEPHRVVPQIAAAVGWIES
jgi:Protein of unknown function (DUF4240)